jgi:hypothetical protein
MSGAGSGTPSPQAGGAKPSLIRRILHAVHPRGGPSWPAGEPQAIVSFEDAERAAFRSATAATPGTPITTQAGALPVAPIAPISPGSPTFVLAPAKHEETAASFPPFAPFERAQPAPLVQPDVARSEESPPEPAPVPSPPEGIAGRRRRRPGETAPESLLRTPDSAASVADDFFDGLIRRVEGDR